MCHCKHDAEAVSWCCELCTSGQLILSDSRQCGGRENGCMRDLVASVHGGGHPLSSLLCELRSLHTSRLCLLRFIPTSE